MVEICEEAFAADQMFAWFKAYRLAAFGVLRACSEWLFADKALILRRGFLAQCVDVGCVAGSQESSLHGSSKRILSCVLHGACELAVNILCGACENRENIPETFHLDSYCTMPLDWMRKLDFAFGFE